MEELIKVLQELALSPVKADNQAISRIEHRCGKSIDLIISELENSSIIQQAVLTNPQKKHKFSLIRQLLVASFVSAMVGMTTLFLRPDIARPIMILGFVAGFCEFSLSKENK